MRRSPSPGPLEQAFFEHTGRPVDKWVHYLPFYDRALAPYRGAPVRLLEIGVSHGGSLELWRRYFGSDATIFGIDIDPACANRRASANHVRIGSQSDAEFLNGVVAEMGGVDIVIDDGSHVAGDQRAAFRALWPLLTPGGLYVIEDMHTAYFPRCDGGYQRPGTAIEMLKQIIDDMHGWYHGLPGRAVERGRVASLLVADSIGAIEKARIVAPPGHVVVGGP